MAQEVKKGQFEIFDASAYRVGIVVAQFNRDVTDGLLESALETAEKYGISREKVGVLAAKIQHHNSFLCLHKVFQIKSILRQSVPADSQAKDCGRALAGFSQSTYPAALRHSSILFLSSAMLTQTDPSPVCSA